MKQKKLSELTDQELLKEAKHMKSNSIINAFLVGVLIAVIVYSYLKNGFGFLLIILIFFVYKLVNSSEYKKNDIERLLKERNLKI